MNVIGKVIVVTGGSSGLGAATVRMIHDAGGRAVIADVNVEAGAALQKELSGPSLFVETDVSSEDSARGLVKTTLETYGRLDGLVNCAGIAPAERVVGRDAVHKLETFQRVLAVNLLGTFNVSRLAAEAMSKQAACADGERGVIVNTASVAAYDGQIGQSAYAASKAGVAGMTLPLARELARYGIRVVAIAPGIFETPMLLNMAQEIQDALGRMVPFPQRMGRPAEFAFLVKHIFENQMLNGEVIRLDGAIRMQAK